MSLFSVCVCFSGKKEIAYPKHMGCLLDKNRRRQPWLQTRHLLCPQPRKLQHLTSQYHQQHRGGAEGAPAVSSIPLRCQMLQLSWLRTQQLSCLQPRLPPAVFVQQTTHVLRVSSKRNGGFLCDGNAAAAHRQRGGSPPAAGRDAQLSPGGRRTQQEPFAGRSREKHGGPWPQAK